MPPTPTPDLLGALADAQHRSEQQRRAALQNANRVRVARAALKQRLRRGEASISDVLTNPPEYMATASVGDVLLAVPKVGRFRAGRVLSPCRISPAKTLGQLTVRQRAQILMRVEA